MENPSNPSPVVELQSAFNGLALICVEDCAKHIGHIIDYELWRANTRRDGAKFASLPNWVVHPQPEGLGVATQQSADFLRSLLLDTGRVADWAAILDHIRTKRGRPKKVVADEDFRPFYRVSKASNAIDRRLIDLHAKAPNLFQQFAEGAISLDEALLKAGISRKRAGFIGRVKSLIVEYADLGEEGQIEMLMLLWSHTSLDARTDFLAKAQAS